MPNDRFVPPVSGDAFPLRLAPPTSAAPPDRTYESPYEESAEHAEAQEGCPSENGNAPQNGNGTGPQSVAIDLSLERLQQADFAVTAVASTASGPSPALGPTDVSCDVAILEESSRCRAERLPLVAWLPHDYTLHSYTFMRS